MNNIEKKLIETLKKTFKINKIPINFKKLQMGDIKKWDSLGNYQLLIAIEKQFKIRFETSIFTELKSIKEILKAIKNEKNFIIWR
jgi:acyl carrier protein|tara:strand:+ start:119 stop:373 length:255 start_codon:yes stop_codon:yes gene_type:complete